jgi:hypothetical protein
MWLTPFANQPTHRPIWKPPQGRKSMQMMVGSPRDGGPAAAAAALPAPTDGGVRLSVAGGEALAVLRFSGYITPQAADEARRRLVAALEQGARGGGVLLASPLVGCSLMRLYCEASAVL